MYISIEMSFYQRKQEISINYYIQFDWKHGVTFSFQRNVRLDKE